MGCFVQDLFVDSIICAIMVTLTRTVMDSTGVVAGCVAGVQLLGLEV